MSHYQAKMSSKGQLTIPLAVREHLGLKPGDMVDFHIDDAGRVHIITENESISDHLKSFGVPDGFRETAAEYAAKHPGRVSRHSIFDRLDKLTLPSLGRPLTQADIDAAIGEAMEEQERRIRNQRRR